MEIGLQEDENPRRLSVSRYDLAIIGKAVDDRGRAAVRFVRRLATRTVSVDYQDADFSVSIDGVQHQAESLTDYFRDAHALRIVLEASTLGFVDIFLICRAMAAIQHATMSLVYVEPRQYSNPRRTQLLHRRDFDLSDQVPGYRPVPGATFMLTDRRPQRGVFFLGYEEQRLDRAFEDFQMMRPSLCSVVFGVPAFRPGWEMDAFANNIRVIRERNIRGGVYFCGAENPAAVVATLEEIYQELAPDERLFLVPIGTKPMGVGVALFAAIHPNVGILYDHPRRRPGRSTQTGKWHLFDVAL